MRLLRSTCVFVLVWFALLLLAWSASSPALAQSAPTDDDNNPGQKRTDLVRALANSGQSPDRLVIVYDAASGATENHPNRLRARQRAGGQLLRADAALARDVVRVAGANAEALARVLRNAPGVLDAYPDPVATISVAYNDPLAVDEWGLRRIQAQPAWDKTVGANVKVAVLDCGIHASHPDLSGKVALQQNFTGAATTDDGCNHGTHVAGTIAARMNNGTGVVGVAPGATLLNGKVLDDAGSGFFSDIDRGIQWAADNGARVINLSLNADIACPTSTQNAIDYAWSNGVVVVAAAGNSGLKTAGAPAVCNNVIGVAASDQNDQVVTWSNSGTRVAVAAPGTDILSTVNPNLNEGELYRTLSGTSMASPHVAGEAALLWASMPGGTTATAVRDRLLKTADRIAGTGTAISAGRVNVGAAVGARVNLALGKPATQSSTFAGADAERAVDGNTDGSWAVGSIAHTNYDAKAWWQVDLQKSEAINRVDIWNRTDCCGDRLQNFRVRVSNDAATWTSVTVTPMAGSPTSVPIDRSARYVRIELNGTNYLALAEVQVWGGAPPAASNTFANAPRVSTIAVLSGSTTSATTETGEPGPCGGSSKTVWYRVVPTASGRLTLDTAGSGFNTVLAVYTGSSVSTLKNLGCNDDPAAGNTQAKLSLAVTAGQTYWVQLGGHAGASGAFRLAISGP